MRAKTLPVLLATCLMLVLVATATPTAHAADGVQAPAAVPADLDVAPTQEPGLGCPAASMLEPVFLAPQPLQTCEECQDECLAERNECTAHCDRLCLSCLNKYFKCLDNCPC